MDEHDFDQILQTDFHPNVHTADHHHLHLIDEDQQHAHDIPEAELESKRTPLEQDEGVVIDPTLDAGRLEEEPPIIVPPVKRLPRDPGSHLTPDEKKRIQREQNRMAAIRSRRKKSGQLGVLEGDVETLQRENERLRARLNALSAGQPGSSSPALEHAPIKAMEATESHELSPGIDHQYFRKVAQDIQYLREALIGREIDLQRERAGNNTSQPDADDETLRLRGELTQRLAKLTMLRSEEKAIQTIIRGLRLEKETLGKDRAKISKELDTRLAVKKIEANPSSTIYAAEEADVEEGSAMGPVEKALLDVRGWIDETLAKWNENLGPQESEIPLDPQFSEQHPVST